jgi:hypothetical protein
LDVIRDAGAWEWFVAARGLVSYGQGSIHPDLIASAIVPPKK